MSTVPPSPATVSPSVRYALLAVAVIGLSLIGYIGFVVYPSLDLSAGVGAGLLVLAVAAGVASFFSPCSFPLLVGMLGRPLAERRTEEEIQRQPTGDSLIFASALSLGVVAFLTLLGAVIAFGGDALVRNVTFTSTAGRVLRISVGTFLIFVALIQLDRLNISLRRFEPATRAFHQRGQTPLVVKGSDPFVLVDAVDGRVHEQRPFLRFTLFGFGYLAAGFG